MVYIGAGHEPDATGRGPAPGGSIYGLSLLTGKLQWTLPVPGEDILTTPTAGGAVLYFVGGDFFQEMYIHAVDLKTQQEKWKLKLPDLIYETGFAPVVVGNFVYVAGHRGLYAVDARTGSLMWDFTTGSIQASRLDTSACCNDEGKTGYGTNGEDYSIRATNVFTSFYRPTAQVRTAPVVSDGVIYFAVNVDTDAPVAPGYSNEIDFYLLGLDARTGQERWRYRSETELIEGPVVTTDTIYVGSMHHYVEAIDIKTKLVQWRFYPDDFLSGDLVRAENTLYFGDNNSNVYALLTTPLGMPTAGDPNRIAPFMAMPAMAVTLALISLILGIILSVHKRLKDQRHASVGRSSRRV
jgi:outer membrane protein assembly factor BamB